MPPSACSSRPFFCWRASVKAPRSWPKSSLSSSVSGSAEHVMFTNGPRGARARVVEDLRRQILARAALAGEEHGRRRARGDALEQRLEFAQLRRFADHPIEAVRLGLGRAQLPHLAPQPRRLERLLDHRGQRLEVERLVHEVVGAELHRLDGRVHARVGREQNHQHVRIDLADAA